MKLTSAEAVEKLSAMRRKGQVVFGEVTPAALAKDGTELSKGSWSHGAAFVASPPLRPDPEMPAKLLDSLARLRLSTGQLTISTESLINALFVCFFQ